MRPRSGSVAVGKEHCELLAAVAVGDTAAADACEPAGDELQHLVAHVVSVSIVEALEMVDVDHRERVARPEAAQPLLQRAPAEEAGELVAERELVRLLEQRHEQHRSGRRHEGAERVPSVKPLGRDEERQPPGQAGDHREGAGDCGVDEL